MFKGLKESAKSTTPNNTSIALAKLIAEKLGADFQNRPRVLTVDGVKYAFSCSPVNNTPDCRQFYPELHEALLWFDLETENLFLVPKEVMHFKRSRKTPNGVEGFSVSFDKTSVKVFKNG